MCLSFHPPTPLPATTHVLAKWHHHLLHKAEWVEGLLMEGLEVLTLLTSSLILDTYSALVSVTLDMLLNIYIP